MEYEKTMQMNGQENTLNIGALVEGFVLDHIEAGHAMTIYRYLKLGKLDYLAIVLVVGFLAAIIYMRGIL